MEGLIFGILRCGIQKGFLPFPTGNTQQTSRLPLEGKMYHSNNVKILKIQTTRKKYKAYQGKWHNSITQRSTCLLKGNVFFCFRFLEIVRERESPVHQCYELQLKALMWWKVKGEFTFVFLKKTATETTLLGRLECIKLFSLIHSIVFLEMFHSPK